MALDVTNGKPVWPGAWGALVFSGLCLLAVVLHLLAAIGCPGLAGERGAASRFMTQIAALGSGLAMLAIVWQALPTLIGH